MQALKDRILEDGVVIGDSVLKVDSFLNHQVDPKFIMDMGSELAGRFEGQSITKILTVEASGIAVAMAVGLYLKVPVVFAKKKKAATQNAGHYQADIYSFTRGEKVGIFVSQSYLQPADKVLIVDDFLAHGEALRGLVDIVRQAGASLAGTGIVIEKAFQKGGDALRQQGIRIESLASIQSMAGGNIVFS